MIREIKQMGILQETYHNENINIKIKVSTTNEREV